jgi:hypothetical protein
MQLIHGRVLVLWKGQNTTGIYLKPIYFTMPNKLESRFVRRTIPNLALLRPIRSLANLPEKRRRSLLKNMENYLWNCEYEDKRLKSLKERVNRP